AVQNNRISSIRKAATSYDIPRTTLQDHLNGTAPRSVS
ncbi:Helix-turn-helix Psq, partial [Macrophomina phaseolina MS6]